jgi:hypothetical protein
MDNQDLVTAFYQTFDQTAPDELGAADDQHAHAAQPTMRPLRPQGQFTGGVLPGVTPA